MVIDARVVTAQCARDVRTAKERALMSPDERRECLDLLDPEPRDGARPLRRTIAKVGFERRGRVRIARHIIAVGEAIAEEHVHHRAGERAIRPGPQL